jgi:addiction module HigA family antidote
LPESLTVGEAAARLGVTRQALSALLNGRAGVSADMARRLSRALHTSAEMWLTMQAAHDLYMAERKPLPRVRSILKKAPAAV